MRALVILIAPGAFVLSLLLDLHMQSVGDLVGALGLLAGVFISAFALVFSLRINLAARPTRVVERRTARLMDESALTLLAAGLLSGVDAIWLAGVSVSIPEEGYVVSAFATAVTVALSSLVVVYFLLSIRRLHKLYTDTFVPFWRVKTVVDGPTGEDSSRATKADASDIDARRNG
ncbi:hypothetical protein DEI98_06715 [Curtobacterium sp. MCLR17_034]|nr:hypothetical protein DEI98_06715 [Curtobacterium sp. MCLR17_034]